MSRPNPLILSAVLLLFVLAFGGLPLLKGGLYLDTHEGDSYHLLDILFRMSEGQVPHLDFPTPLGILAFLPFTLLMEAGQSVGRAIMLGQLGVSLILLPFVVYAAATRLTKGLAWYFGLVTLGTALALSFGGAYSGATISMHYNRWAWAATFVVLVLAILPARGRDRPGFDALAIGLLCGALLLLKVTYFVSVTPAAALALFLRDRWTGLGYAVAGGLAVMAVATLVLGPSIWLAYLTDLRTVAANDIRPFVGVPFNEIISGPVYLGATLTGLAAIILVTRAGYDSLALVFLVMVPGFVYITYQNYGNDPVWLLLIPVLLLTLRPDPGVGRQVFGLDSRAAMTGLAAIAIALNFPSLANSALANLRHTSFSEARFVPMLPEDDARHDVYIRIDRAYTMTAQVDLDRTMPEWSRYSAPVEREPLATLGGVTFPQCEWMAGSRAYFETVSESLIAEGIPQGSQFFTADILTVFWLFGPFRPLEGGAPWYYGGLSGLENADYVLIPKCSFVARVRGIMIDDLAASGLTFTLERDNDLYALFSVNR